MSPIISPSELKALSTENLIILDARTGKEVRQNYLEKHIKGARFIDLDKDLAEVGKDAAFGGRHPLPALEKFAETLSELGIVEDAHIIVYDDKNGSNAAARAWWMLRSFGFENVQVLDGGMQAAEKSEVEFSSGEEMVEKAPSIKKEDWSLPVSRLEVVENELKNESSTVIDVRDAYRYRGESEPIDLVAGHIPGAINIPFSENLDENGRFLSPEVLKAKYENLLQGKPEHLIIHCGSGVTACHTILALAHAGFEIPDLYVGSWSEWSRREGKEIAKDYK
ncbi:thiosulfate/3-mercaptopyruvate sulfurtransferase [Chryseobacterium indologenes]|uniref:sulfurtransferase n=1 Tax=Chryseobacterium indologenes TaxID=253 RepID=UPI0003E06701|nr:sulfurtransferase [Chryseobacterium indologenes]GAE63543.1 putative sulfurtransferase [Chryseobacterium indologenes NBRC 14944]SFJ65315.1 thiosulfate/3-mercaptopyruvate sulfurtransferase [Chryseobacterium indologenes]SUX52069.1 3-mercaptopyruvate sulfurtransferase [Chryseobacterium indologenes]